MPMGLPLNLFKFPQFIVFFKILLESPVQMLNDCFWVKKSGTLQVTKHSLSTVNNLGQMSPHDSEVEREFRITISAL